MSEPKEHRRFESIEKILKQVNCNHSAYKMLPIFGGLFGICWVCTQCGIIKRDLEVDE